MDGVRIGQKLFAIILELERGAALQSLKLGMFFRPRQPERHGLSAL